MSASKTGSALADLSSQLAAAVESASKSVVAIHARRRIPSSGIVWREGIVVSASHTVRRDEDIAITLANGDSTTATLVGRDPATDLVALKLKGNKPEVGARADAENSRIGSLVLAVGRPGANTTASFGIISAVNEGWRTWQGSRIDRLFRLDLSIYDGFSGGPLVDPSGRILGLNNSALAQGAAAALSAAAVDRVLDELLERGYVRRAFLGIAVHPVSIGAGLVKQLHLQQDTGTMVMSLVEDGPAEKAGVIVGDVLIEANGQPLKQPSDLLDALGSPGSTSLNVKLLRGGVLQSVSITPADRREPEAGRR